MTLRITPDSVPTRIAQAYGLGERQPSISSPPEQSSTRDIYRRDDIVDLRLPAPSESASQLVAAQVSARVHFAAPPAPSGAQQQSISMYRHPADRNAAATGVEAGRVIDVSG